MSLQSAVGNPGKSTPLARQKVSRPDPEAEIRSSFSQRKFNFKQTLHVHGAAFLSFFESLSSPESHPKLEEARFRFIDLSFEPRNDVATFIRVDTRTGALYNAAHRYDPYRSSVA